MKLEIGKLYALTTLQNELTLQCFCKNCIVVIRDLGLTHEELYNNYGFAHARINLHQPFIVLEYGTYVGSYRIMQSRDSHNEPIIGWKSIESSINQDPNLIKDFRFILWQQKEAD